MNMPIVLSELYAVYQQLPELLKVPIRILYDTMMVPFSSGHRLYWLYLLTAIFLAFISYSYYSSREKRQDSFFKKFFVYLVPRHIYTHPSAILDYKLFIVSPFLKFIFRPLTSIVASTVVAVWVNQLLTVHITWEPIDLGNVLYVIIFTFCFALSADFGTFLSHWLQHKCSLLWPLHSLHHSAEVLTPITALRSHPLSTVIDRLIGPPIIGICQGIVTFIFLGESDYYSLLGLNIIYCMFNFFGANLRHSHIWFSFGPYLNYILISPAHHQIHHSARPEHHDCNFGEVFAIWDWLFGTLVLPSEEIRKNLIFGININEPQRHPTLFKAYMEPLDRIAKQLYKLNKRKIKPQNVS